MNTYIFYSKRKLLQSSEFSLKLGRSDQNSIRDLFEMNMKLHLTDFTYHQPAELTGRRPNRVTPLIPPYRFVNKLNTFFYFKRNADVTDQYTWIVLCKFIVYYCVTPLARPSCLRFLLPVCSRMFSHYSAHLWTSQVIRFYISMGCTSTNWLYVIFVLKWLEKKSQASVLNPLLNLDAPLSVKLTRHRFNYTIHGLTLKHYRK